MKAYVTGGLGFIGIRVVQRLCQNGVAVVCIDRRGKLDSMMSSGLPICRRICHAASMCVDIRESTDDLGQIMPDDVLIHLGAVVDTGKSDADIFAQNIDYPRRVFPKFKRIVFASSGAVYGNSGHPDTIYGLTKAVGERMLAREMHFQMGQSIALRFMNVYGEDEHHKGEMASMPFKLAQAYDRQGLIQLFNWQDSRDFVHVDDVASAVIAASARVSGQACKSFEVYDVGSGKSTSFEELNGLVRFQDENSLAKLVDMPRHLAGRYQHYTCAGNMSSEVKNVFDQPWCAVHKPTLIEHGARKLRCA